MAQSTKRCDSDSVNARLLKLIKSMKMCERVELVKMLEEKKNGDYRKHNRSLCFMPVDYRINGHVYRDFIQDISDSGMFIETKRHLCVGDEIMISFVHPAFKFPVKVGGIIARSSDNGYGVNFISKNGNGNSSFAHKQASEATGIEMPSDIEAMLNAA